MDEEQDARSDSQSKVKMMQRRRICRTGGEGSRLKNVSVSCPTQHALRQTRTRPSSNKCALRDHGSWD